MPNLHLLLETLIHLRFTQVYHQVMYRLHKPEWEKQSAPLHTYSILLTSPISKYSCHEGCDV